MPVITIFSANFCEEKTVASRVAEELGYELVENEVIKEASRLHGVSAEKLHRAMHGNPSLFNAFTGEKERGLAYIQEAFSSMLLKDNIVYLGFAAHLLPTNMNHVLKVCLLASKDHRTKTAIMKEQVGSKKEAIKLIQKNNQEIGQWVKDRKDTTPWDKKLYDIKLPMHTTSVDDAVALICENVSKEIMKTTDLSRAATEDFHLASKVKVALVEAGHYVDVTCSDSFVEIVIDKYVMRLEALSAEMAGIAKRVDGVRDAEVKVGPHFHEANIYRKQNFELPSKVLLVDDETEFVQTLSERLQMRDFGTIVASNGEQALEMVKEDEPEVMVLDLRMPGIDGMEVLQRMKKSNPDVEVIILTGHGSEKDRELAMELGAFAYLEKPVDIELLSRTMKAAHEKAQRDKEDGK